MTFSVTPEGGVIGLRSRMVRRDLSLPKAAAFGLTAPFRIMLAGYEALTGPGEVALSGPVALMREASATGRRGVGFYILGSLLAVAYPFALVLDVGTFGVLWLLARRRKA